MTRMGKSFILLCALCIGLFAQAFLGHKGLFAQGENNLAALSKQVIEEPCDACSCTFFDQIKEIYFKDNKYNEFVEFLSSLINKKGEIELCADYYIGLTRYRQLRFLEEVQGWDEYFSQGNNYRDQITGLLQKVISSLAAKCPIHLYSRLTLWQFHRDQQDVFHEQALSDLMNSALEYALESKDMSAIKEVADSLSSYGEKGNSKQLYKIYVESLISSQGKDDEIKNNALLLYKSGNLELAESLFDVYINKISGALPKEKLAEELIGIAKLFYSNSESKLKDLAYAESIFSKLENSVGKEAFTQDLLYQRAFNLEKAKEYGKAKDIYLELIKAFPGTNRYEESIFKIGVISLLALRDINPGKEHLDKLGQKETLTPYVASSLYYLGLINQWENNPIKAKEYYGKLLEKASGAFSDLAEMAKERLKEMEENKPLSYNIKTFLDVSLKPEFSNLSMARVELNTSEYELDKDQTVKVNSTAYVQETGCMQLDIQYLWALDTGREKPQADKPAFDTSFSSHGAKIIALTIISPAGIMDRSFQMVDVD